MAAIGRHLERLDLDVMAFQEVWTSDARRILVEAGRAAGLANVWHNEAAFGGSGLLVLSRLPIVDVCFEQFTLRGQPERITQLDYYGGKGFSRVRLQTEIGAVTLINTHLHARYGSRVPHEYRSLRAAQVVELAVRARETNEPILAAGDFNFQDDQAGYWVLTGLTGFRDAAAEVGRRMPTLHRGNAYRAKPNKRERRIDYLFARDGDRLAVRTLQVERIFDEPIEIAGRAASYSNHAGVMADFAIAPHAGGGLHRPDRSAIALAAKLLSEGRDEAMRRQRTGRTLASVGIGGAAVALGSVRWKPMTRRRLLRRALRSAGLLSLTPGIGFSILSEFFVSDELEGFDAVSRRLSQLDLATAAETIA
jgi:endonuclease/exonuclease/phosphatase family metal-dependent hydrolase